MLEHIQALVELLQQIRKELYSRAAAKDAKLAKLLEVAINSKGQEFNKISFQFYHVRDKEMEILWDLYVDTKDKIKELINKEVK